MRKDIIVTHAFSEEVEHPEAFVGKVQDEFTGAGRGSP